MRYTNPRLLYFTLLKCPDYRATITIVAGHFTTSIHSAAVQLTQTLADGLNRQRQVSRMTDEKRETWVAAQ